MRTRPAGGILVGGDGRTTRRLVGSERLTRAGTSVARRCDTEGFEHEVLCGATASLGEHCVGVCVEITPHLSGTETAGRTLALLASGFDRFFAATGEPLAIAELRARVEAGAEAQFDLVGVDQRKLAAIATAAPQAEAGRA